jgi:hypothetical protein
MESDDSRKRTIMMPMIRKMTVNAAMAVTKENEKSITFLF